MNQSKLRNIISDREVEMQCYEYILQHYLASFYMCNAKIQNENITKDLISKSRNVQEKIKQSINSFKDHIEYIFERFIDLENEELKNSLLDLIFLEFKKYTGSYIKSLMNLSSMIEELMIEQSKIIFKSIIEENQN